MVTGCYDAADVLDRERAEWPPHPARLFCALVAAARTVLAAHLTGEIPEYTPFTARYTWHDDDS